MPESKFGKTCRAVEMDALVVNDLKENFTYGRLIVDFANKDRMPTIYPTITDRAPVLREGRKTMNIHANPGIHLGNLGQVP